MAKTWIEDKVSDEEGKDDVLKEMLRVTASKAKQEELKNLIRIIDYMSILTDRFALDFYIALHQGIL